MSSIRDLLLRLRPLAIKDIHNSRIEAYKAAHRDANGGKDPTPVQIGQFVQILVAGGEVIKEADQFLEEAGRQIRRAGLRELVVNTLLTVPVLTTSAFSAYVCFSPELPDVITVRNSAFLIGIGITSVLVLLFVSAQTVMVVLGRKAS
jgi:hypothetical protein